MERQKLFVSLEDVSPGIYSQRLLDRLTKMHFIIPFIVYIPVIIFFAVRAIVVKEISALHFLWLLPLITVFWSWLEYVLHKHFLHRRPDGTATVEIVNRIHEAHHDYPNDSFRLVVPLWVSVPGALVFYGLCRLIFGSWLVDAAFATLVFYYLVYEFAHISAHKINSKNSILQKIKKHHLKHHFQDDQKGFGFTSTLWDIWFGTAFDQRK